MTVLAQRIRIFARDRAGAALVEFALLAPVMLAMLFALIEGGRLYWVKQTLNEVAYTTARCMSVSSACASDDAPQSYAVERARDYAILVDLSDVTVAENTTCRGVTGSNEVSITHHFNSPAKGLLPFLPDELSAIACFPVLS